MPLVFSAPFGGNGASVGTPPGRREFYLELSIEGSTPGSLSWELRVVSPTRNQKSPYGTFTWNVNIGGTPRNGTRAFSFSAGANNLLVASGPASTTASSITASGSASGGGTILSASGSGSYSSPPPVTTYSLSYDAGGGSPTPGGQTLAGGAAFTVGAAPTRSGFTFVHWSGSNGTNYAAATSASMPSSNLSLTAVWAPPAPTGLAVGTRTQTSIQLSWDATAGASGYSLLRNGTVVTSTTATSYTYVGLTAGTAYSLGVRAVSSSGGNSPTSAISTSTLSSNPVFPDGVVYPLAKIGSIYAGSVTATNAQSYELAYGNLPPGLTLNTENGTIGGTTQRPEQRPEGIYFNDTNGTLDSFTFGIRAIGPEGSTPTVKQFVIRTVFPGERLGTLSRDLIIARRWDGNAWVPIQTAQRFNGSAWVDISTT